METYRVYEVVVKIYGFAVKAESEEAARKKLENAGWQENGNDILRQPEYDKDVDRTTESTGTVGEPEGNMSIT